MLRKGMPLTIYSMLFVQGRIAPIVETQVLNDPEELDRKLQMLQDGLLPPQIEVQPPMDGVVPPTLTIGE